MRAKASLAFASMLIGAVAGLSAPADAACKKFGFTVNDYGKEGPTNDAKNLLDKHIAEWATQNGVSDYQTGKKSVSCELFLDVLLFDEHTCTASATVCWGPDAKKLGAQSAAAGGSEESSAGAPPAPVRKATALGTEAPKPADTAAAEQAPVETPAAASAPAPADTAEGAAPTTTVERVASPAETPAAATAVHNDAPPATEAMAPAGQPATTGAVVETGTLQAGQGLSQSAPTGAVAKERAAAAAAAASAAAAAERAAAAAETAANAAKEAAAAAVAASAASKAPVKIPPLDHASGAPAVHNE